MKVFHTARAPWWIGLTTLYEALFLSAAALQLWILCQAHHPCHKAWEL